MFNNMFLVWAVQTTVDFVTLTEQQKALRNWQVQAKCIHDTYLHKANQELRDWQVQALQFE